MQTELNKVVAALQEFYAREAFLFEKDLGERTLTHRLAVHLERQFSGWEVDCDYNRLGERRLRLPHIRRHAPEVVATAKAQRWEPAEVLKALLAEEVAGRERSALATRRAAAGFPTGKTFDAWQPDASSIPTPTQQALRTLEWVHRR